LMPQFLFKKEKKEKCQKILKMKTFRFKKMVESK